MATRRRLAAVPILLVSAIVAGGAGLSFSKEMTRSDSVVIPGSVDIFPSFPSMQAHFKVEVPSDADLALLLSLTSLQGLVNRQGVQMYLDTEGRGNTTFLLPLLETRYNVTFSAISAQQFLRDYSSFATGLVVYDPTRPATINVATVDAGVHDRIVVDPDSAEAVAQTTGLRVELDLRLAPWAGLTDIQLYRRSFQEFYPECDRKMLAILPPSKTGLRDYFVAAKAWTFHVGQGPFSSQEEIDFTEDVLAATPRNIPLLGWFEAPTLTEENFLVQVASRYGKSILGGQDVPNLSFLSGLASPVPFKQKRMLPASANPAENGIYVSFAVPDGDNLDFIANRMREMWGDEIRGTIPIAWSVNPLLAAIAPPLLDYYYSSASSLDSFVAAPSGAGYIYPGFTRDADLKEYLLRARNFMAMTDIDVVWLLNSFTAYEIQYSEETLDAYVAGLKPRGIILDYADEAATLDAWVEGNDDGASPVIRSTHLWSGRENVVGKIMANVDAAPARAHFFLVTVYPWSLDLSEAIKCLDFLRGRYGDRVEAVSVEALLSLLTRDFVDQAERMVDGVNKDILSSLDAWDLADAASLVEQARRDSTLNRTDLAGLHAYKAIQRARRAMAVGVAALLAILACAFAGAALLSRKLRYRRTDRRPVRFKKRLYPCIASALLFYLFFGGLQKALDYHFWTYGGVFLAGALIPFTPRIQSRLGSVVKEDSWLIEVGVMSLSGVLLLREPWAFVPFACSCAMLLNRFMRRADYPRGLNALLLGTGLVGGIISSFSWWSLAACAGALVTISFITRPAAPSLLSTMDGTHTTGVNFAATTLAISVIWLTPIQNRFFTEKASGGLDFLLWTSVFALLAAPVVALALWKVLGPFGRTGGFLSLTLTAGLWAAVWLLQNQALLAVLLMSLAVTICWSHLSSSSRVKWTSLATGRFVSSLLILGTIVVVLVRMPAIVYSLYIVRLPLAVEYILYTPPLLMIFATLDIVQTEALFRAVKKKDTAQE